MDDVERLLELLESRHWHLSTRGEGSPRQLAAGALTRAEGLLRGIRLLVDVGRDDLVGLFIRAIWECWCVGLYVLLGGPDKVAELEETHRRWIKVYRDRWPDQMEAQPDVDDNYLAAAGEAEPTPRIEAVARDVERMLRTADVGPIAYGDVSSYDVLYRLESTFSTHAGLALFERYLTLSDDGSRQEVVAVPSHPTLKARAASVGAAYTAHLAWHVYRAFGISVAGLDSLFIRIAGYGGMIAPGPTTQPRTDADDPS